MNKNQAHIEGPIGAIHLTSVQEGTVRANVTIVTYSSQPSGVPKPIPVRATIEAKSKLAKTLVEFNKSLNGDKIRPGSEGYKPVYLSVDGPVRMRGDEIYINAAEGKTKQIAKVQADSNTASIEGTVKNITDNGKSIAVLVQTDDGPVTLNMRHERLPEGFSELKSGKLSVGDKVSVQGPIIGGSFTNGKENIFVSFVAPHRISEIKKKVKKTTNITM